MCMCMCMCISFRSVQSQGYPILVSDKSGVCGNMSVCNSVSVIIFVLMYRISKNFHYLYAPDNESTSAYFFYTNLLCIFLVIGCWFPLNYDANLGIHIGKKVTIICSLKIVSSETHSLFCEIPVWLILVHLLALRLHCYCALILSLFDFCEGVICLKCVTCLK